MFNQAVAPPTVDLICDLRQSGRDIENVAWLHQIWPAIGSLLLGRSPTVGQAIPIALAKGTIFFWVVRSVNVSIIDRATAINITDVIRNPALIYKCIRCGSYGPLRCSKSPNSETPERLCSNCAHFIKDEVEAFCPDHLPACKCKQPDCAETARFRCENCKQVFGTHFHLSHPHEAMADLCQDCHLRLFEPCADCMFGKPRTGKSRCIFRSGTDAKACGKPLCVQHSLQWRVWGSHNRGLTLCRTHQMALAQTGVVERLYMILTAPPLAMGRGRLRNVPRPFSLRRVVNRNLATSYSLEELHQVIASLKQEASGWGHRAAANYRELSNYFNKTIEENGVAEARLLSQIREWYQRRLGRRAAEQIQSVKVIDCFFRPDSPPHYKLRASLPANVDKRPFIKGGRLIEQLCKELNITLEIG